jgi:hypothetical protein
MTTAFLAFLLLSCGCSIISLSKSGRVTQATLPSAEGVEGVFIKGEDGKGCPFPVYGFDEAMLIGKWRAGFDKSSDVLIFREDGSYQQITRIESLDFYEESEWQNWSITYGPSGIPHLHLEGMSLCVPYRLSNCKFKGGGETSWWDFCEDEIVKMPNEGILLAIGVPDGFIAPPRGFDLVPLTRDPDSGGFTYHFEE